MNALQFATFLVIFYAQWDFGTNGISVEKDLRLTQEQKKIMDKFKRIMIPKLPHRYMHEEIYLVRWLRARNFDLKKAEQFLLANLRWRKQHKIDTIHQEDFSDVLAEYPVFVDTYAKNGAPVITAIAGNWDIRQVMLTGKLPRLHRLLYKIMDEACIKVREAQQKGKHVTRFHFLLNLDGFNLIQHGCPRCILGILEFIEGFENHFPEMTDKIVIFNAPPTIEVLRPVVLGALSLFTQDHLTVIGTNKPEWQNLFLSFIDASQLTEDFGGSRVRDYY